MASTYDVTVKTTYRVEAQDLVAAVDLVLGVVANDRSANDVTLRPIDHETIGAVKL